MAPKVLSPWNHPFDPLPHCTACSVGRTGLSSKHLSNVPCSSSFDALFVSVLGRSSSGFGNLVPVSVSFLVCSGSDPHLSPYLAVTEINWLGSSSKCRLCTCFASSLKFPPYPLFHCIPIHQPIEASY